MKTIRTSMTKLAALAFACAFFSMPSLKAQILTLYVDINTSALTSAPNGPFFLDFELNQGSGSLTNTATVSNFVYTGGTPTGGTSTTGSATGNIGSTVQLTSTNNPSGSAFSDLNQEFSPGTSDIKFTVQLTNNSAGTTPTGFDISVLNSLSGNPQILTNDPNQGLSLVSVNLGTPLSPATVPGNVSVYHSIGTDGTYTDGDGGVTAVVTPEPSSWIMLVLGAGVLTYLRLRSRKV